MSSAVVNKSAGNIAFGLVFVIGGGAAFDVGRQLEIEAALRPFGSGGGGGAFIFVGGAAALIGLIVLVFGVHQLARNIDYLAERAATRDATPSRAAAPARPPAATAPPATPTRDVLPPLRRDEP